MKSLLIQAALVAAFFGIGLWAGPWLHAGYDEIFPEPAYVEGDFRNLYKVAQENVVLFSTSTCPHCKDERAFLDAQNIRYKDFVVDQSPEAEHEFESWGAGPVPLLFVGTRRILGFREGVLRDSLKLRPLPK